MELSHLLDTLLGIVVAVFGWLFSSTLKEQKRLEILLNKTREEIGRDYVTKTELRDDVRRISDGINRLEDKLDRVLTEK